MNEKSITETVDEKLGRISALVNKVLMCLAISLAFGWVGEILGNNILRIISYACLFSSAVFAFIILFIAHKINSDCKKGW